MNNLTFLNAVIDFFIGSFLFYLLAMTLTQIFGQTPSIILYCFCFFLVLYSIYLLKKSRLGLEKNFPLLFDMLNENALLDPYTPKNASQVHSSIEKIIQDKNKVKSRLKSWTLLVWVFASGILTLQNDFIFTELQISFAKLGFSFFSTSPKLSILEGMSDKEKPTEYNLSTRSTHNISLLSENLLELTVPENFLKNNSTEHYIELRSESFSKKFQLHKENDENNSMRSIKFSVTQSGELFLPFFSSQALLQFNVIEKPTPKVQLSAVSQTLPDEAWSDSDPFELAISAEGDQPLHFIYLQLHRKQGEKKELVLEIMDHHLKKITQPHSILFENYIEEDQEEIELVAEVHDRSQPESLIGYSNPISLTVVSSYGRYRESLAKLSTVKSHLDQMIEDHQLEKLQETKENFAKAHQSARRSPYFDDYDRNQWEFFDMQINSIDGEKDWEKILNLSDKMNQFLFEHEILDDRERDRDFFVSSRAFSRQIESDPELSKPLSQRMQKQVKEFLTERHKRWKLRTDRLGKDFSPPSTHEIVEQKKIIKNWNELSFDRNSKQKKLADLSSVTNQYREWIEALEKKEDEFFRKTEEKRMEGLSSAKETLKELQKRQGEISQSLDQASQKDSKVLEEKWPVTKMKQNSNEKETRQLEGQLRSLSPLAGERLKYAIEAMDQNISAGDQNNFQLSESSSDLAGRLLRQAQEDASKEKERQTSRGRRRRVSGDNYYGKNIVGGDVNLKREYEVDKKYREDILDEVRRVELESDDKKLLDTYLNQIIR